MPLVSTDAVLTYDEMLKVIDQTEDLKERLFELGEDNVELICDLEDEEAPLQFKINSEKFTLQMESALQILSFAKIPKSVLDNYDVDVLVPLVNWYYAHKSGELKALIKGNEILAFTKPKTTIYSMKDILSEMIRSLDNFEINEFHFERVQHSLKETQFCLVAPRKVKILDNGDILRAGVFVQYSTVGAKPLVMKGYVSRDYHDNGMISSDVSEMWDRRKDKSADDIDDDDFFDVYTWAYDTCDTVFRAFDREAGAVEDLMNFQLDSHAGTLFNDVFKRNNIPAAVQKLVREEYVDQPGQTLYDVWNSMTLTADRPELDGNTSSQRKVMEAGGNLAAHPRSCPSCHRLTEEDDH